MGNLFFHERAVQRTPSGKSAHWCLYFSVAWAGIELSLLVPLNKTHSSSYTCSSPLCEQEAFEGGFHKTFVHKSSIVVSSLFVSMQPAHFRACLQQLHTTNSSSGHEDWCLFLGDVLRYFISSNFFFVLIRWQKVATSLYCNPCVTQCNPVWNKNKVINVNLPLT